MSRSQRIGPFGWATLAYLALVLVLGGASAAGAGANLLLQVLGAGLAAWALHTGTPELPGAHMGVVESLRARLYASPLRWFGVALLLLALVQFVPLPPVVWRHLPGRAPVAAGFALLGAPAPWMTLSLSPWHSLSSLTAWLPALALYLAMRSPERPPLARAAMVVAWIAAASVLLGFFQRFAGTFTIYTITNAGLGDGFFANANHQGSFLLMALTLCGGAEMALAGKTRRRVAERRAQRPAWWRTGGRHYGALAFGALLMAGVVATSSLAAQTLLVPVMLGLALIARPDWRSGWLVAGAGVLALIAVGFALFGPVGNDLLGHGAVAGISRHDFLAHGLVMLRDFAPFGSGLGSFAELYRWYENMAQVTSIFVNHAHDDLLELLIETGVFGAAALAAFLGWFVPRAIRLWRGFEPDPLMLGASIGVGAVLLHSLADYPLRTAAMSGLVAIGCAIMRGERDLV